MDVGKKMVFYSLNKSKQICIHPFSPIDLQFIAASPSNFDQTLQSIEETYKPIIQKNGEKLKVEDPDSFRHVGGRFFRDNRQLYVFCTGFFVAYKQVDFSSLEVLTDFVAADKTNIFMASGVRVKKGNDLKLIASPPMVEATSVNPKIFGGGIDNPEQNETIDYTNALCRAMKHSKSARLTMVDQHGRTLFVDSGFCSAKNYQPHLYFYQNGFIYYFHHVVVGANAERFRHLSGAYFTDDERIYCRGEALNCDLASFLVLNPAEDSYQATDRYRYFCGEKLGNALGSYRPGGYYESALLTAFFEKNRHLTDYWYFQKFFNNTLYANTEGIYSHGYPIVTKEGPITFKNPMSLQSKSRKFTKWECGFCSIDDCLYYKPDNFVYFQPIPEGDCASFCEIDENMFEDRNFIYTIKNRRISIKKKKEKTSKNSQ